MHNVLANRFFLFSVVFSQMKLLSYFVIYRRCMPTSMIKVMITHRKGFRKGNSLFVFETKFPK